MSEKLKFSLLICFFFLLMIISICLIIKRWNRYSTFSNGTYKNAGQKLIFEIFFSKEEAIQRLYSPAESDTLDYEFWNDNGEYYIKVKGIKRFQQMNGVLTAAFKVDFIQQNGKNYMVVNHINNMQLLYSAGYEAELFEFMTKKLNCVPVSEEIIKVDCYN